VNINGCGSRTLQATSSSDSQRQTETVLAAPLLACGQANNTPTMLQGTSSFHVHVPVLAVWNMLCRRDELLPTLQYVLPWLKCWGYDILTLGEAAAASTAGLPELTFDTLAAHTLGMQGYSAAGRQTSLQQQAANGHGSLRYGSYGDLQRMGGEEDASVRSVSERASVGRGMGRQPSAGSLRQLQGVTDSADKLRMSAAYMAHMAKVRGPGVWHCWHSACLSVLYECRGCGHCIA
jgi:hypothetical protein